MTDIDDHEAFNIAFEDPGILMVDAMTSYKLLFDNIDWLVAAILTWGFWFF